MAKMTKWKVFLSYQHEKEELWLNEMSRSGWNLISNPGFCNYTFTNNDNKRYVYRLDYYNSKKNDMEMISFYKDLDWNFIGKLFNGWYYFKQEEGQQSGNVLYTDNRSKISFFKRVRKTIILGGGIANIPNIPNIIHSFLNPGLSVITCLVVIVMGFLGYNIYRISEKIKNLERSL